MKRMFTAVAALTLLVFANAAFGDEPEDEAEPCGVDPPETHPESWGVPDCENAEFLVQGLGATEVLFDGSAQDGWDVVIRARYDDGYHGVVIKPQHAGVKFNTIEIRPDVSRSPNLADSVTLQFDLFPPASVGCIVQYTVSDPPNPDVYIPVKLVGGLEPDVSGDVGELDVTYIATFWIGGNLGVADESVTSVARVRGRIDGSTGFPGLTVEGDLLAKLVVTNEHPDYTTASSIGGLLIGGDIGLAAPTTAAEEAAGRIETANDIGIIEAGAVYADVLPGFFDEDVKNIHRLIVLKTGSTSGDFFGNLVADSIQHFASGATAGYLLVEGDFGGSVTLQQPLVNPSSLYDGNPPSIVIDGGLVEGTRNPTLIALPEDGLEGQIIINRAFDGGDWEEGVVDVDGTELDAPDYATLPSAVGGGLVGLAPFELYGPACFPQNNSTLSILPGPSCLYECEEAPVSCSIKQCYVQYYGPIAAFESNVMPVYVHTATFEYVPPTWVNVTSEYKASIVSDGQYARLKVERIDGNNLPPDRHYRITPKPDLLRCRFVEDEPDVADTAYYFTIEWQCGLSLLLGTFDLNQNDAIDSGDIAAWVAEPVDFNEDDAADSADLNLLIEAVNLYGDN